MQHSKERSAKSISDKSSVSDEEIFAIPLNVESVADCYFYHTMEIPGYGLVQGPWDLRPGIDAYLGGVNFRNKRVLELGTASGFVCFHMERCGAEVIGYDLSQRQDWDVVPFAKYQYKDFANERKEHIRQLNNGFWLAHEAFNSRSKMVYGDIYSVPSEIGQVDICTACSILLHVRDPFLALQNALKLTRQTVIITEPMGKFGLGFLRRAADSLRGTLSRPTMRFLPDPVSVAPKETWWRLTPDLVKRFIGVLGFEQSAVSYHRQLYRRGTVLVSLPQFTVVGYRTASS